MIAQRESERAADGDETGGDAYFEAKANARGMKRDAYFKSALGIGLSAGLILLLLELYIRCATGNCRMRFSLIRSVQ